MHQQEIKSTLHYGLNASRHRKKVSMKTNLEQELVKQAVLLVILCAQTHYKSAAYL